MRWLLVWLLAIPAIAHANNPSLDDARKAVDDIRYDDAQRLLVQALKQGANQPAELVEIYRLSAATAAVLGTADLAEQYYRRMLALDPDASIPADASPRLREPFVAAQAYMAAQQRFEARATRTPKGIAVTIVDPLGMVIAVATVENGELRAKQPFAGQPVTLDDAGDRVVALDENGNFLRVVELPARPAIEDKPRPLRTPILRRWYTWAIPAVLTGGATTYLFIDAQRTRTRLDDIITHSNQHFLDDAEQERQRWRDRTIGAWVGVGVTLALTTTAIVLARSHPSTVSVTPSVGSDHASVQLEAKF
jgi:hypothetical protein